MSATSLTPEQAARSGVDLSLMRTPRWSTLAVPYIFERQGLDLGRTAIVFGERTRSYGEVRTQARRVAHGLIAAGIEPGDRIALLSRNSLEYIEIETGIAACCAIMVAINWRLRPAEVAAILRRAGARAILVETKFLDAIDKLRMDGEVPALEAVIELGGSGERSYDALLAVGSDAPVPRTPRLEDPHEIIFTSGTTGVPKGVVWSNGGLLFNSLQQVVDYRLGPESSSYAAIDLFYIGGRHDLTWSIFHVGGTVHVKASGGFDAAAVLRYISAHHITHQLWVPAMIYDLLRVEGREMLDFSALRMVMSGGAALSVGVVEEMRRWLPATDIIQVYGLTEGGGSVTCMPADKVAEKPASAGRPSAHVTIRISDDDGRELPASSDGEIWVRAPSMTAGYWGDPGLTEETLGGDWLRTGDIGHLDADGYLYVTGRKKDMIKSGGMNIFPAEIEDVLRRHPAVLDVSVIGVPHEKWGEQVCAVVELGPGKTASEAELIAHCNIHLAGFKKPSRIEFIDVLPRTSSGKPQKFVLRELISRRPSRTT